MIAKITHCEGSGYAENLLRLEAPLLKLWPMHGAGKCNHLRRGEIWIRRSHLGKCFTSGKAFQEFIMRGGCILGQAVTFIWREVVATYAVAIACRWVRRRVYSPALQL